MPKGTLKKRMESYGFINTEDGKDLFFHRNELDGVEFADLKAAQEVEFEMGQDNMGRPQAVKVKLAETQVTDDTGDVGDNDGSDVGQA